MIDREIRSDLRKHILPVIGLLCLLVAVPILALDQHEERSLRDITKIEDDAERLSAFDSWAAEILSLSEEPTQFGDWRYHESKDEMTGQVSSRFVYSYSDNRLSGWISSGKLLLGVTCPDGVYLRANDLRFDSEFTSDFNFQYQVMRVRFDDDPIDSVIWYVWEDNNDGASLEHRQRAAFVQSLLNKERLMVEVELFSSEGRKQVGHFNLLGFAEAYEQCPK